GIPRVRLHLHPYSSPADRPLRSRSPTRGEDFGLRNVEGEPEVRRARRRARPGESRELGRQAKRARRGRRAPRLRRKGPVLARSVPAVSAVQSELAVATAFALSKATLDPAERARILAMHISEAMNGVACGVFVVALEVLILLGFTWRYHWSVRPTE